jgi:hypothetical protein
MIVCAKCGNVNDSRDEFCGSCGAFLEWHGERIAADPVPEPEPVAAPAAEKLGFIGRVKYVVGMDDAAGPHVPDQPPVIQTGGLSGSGGLGGSFVSAPVIGAMSPPVPGPAVGGPPLAPPVHTVGPYPVSSPLDAPLAPSAPTYPPPAGPLPVGSVPMASVPTAPVRPAPVPPQPVAPQPVGPAGPSVGGRLPGQEYERPTAHRPDAIDLGPADVYCGSCGSGNTAGRRFCRKCGASLADAVVAKRSWWKRLFGSGSGSGSPKVKGLEAGERPGRWKKLTVPDERSAGGPTSKKKWRLPRLPSRLPIGKLAPVMIVLSFLGLGYGPARAKVTMWGFGVYNSAKQAIHPTFAPVSAAGATATDAAGGHPAIQGADRVLNTYWAEGRAGTGAGAAITLSFAGPEKFKKVSFRNGAVGKDYAAQPRLQKVEISLFDKENTRVAKQELTLADTEEQQEFDVKGDDVTKATVKIISVYPGQKGQAASIREITFYKAG